MSKFNKKKKYKNTCIIFSPYGVIKENTILTGKQWINILVFDVGNSFNDMFIEVKSNKTNKII